MPTSSNIIDASDFCRACGGRGTIPEPTDRGATLYEICYLCRGSGWRTVRVTPAQEAHHVSR